MLRDFKVTACMPPPISLFKGSIDTDSIGNDGNKAGFESCGFRAVALKREVLDGSVNGGKSATGEMDVRAHECKVCAQEERERE